MRMVAPNSLDKLIALTAFQAHCLRTITLVYHDGAVVGNKPYRIIAQNRRAAGGYGVVGGEEVLL